MDKPKKAQVFYYFYKELLKHCVASQVYLLPWELCSKEITSHQGFICDDFQNDENAHLPLKYNSIIPTWNTLIYNVLNKDGIIPKGTTKDILQTIATKVTSFFDI